MKTVLFACVHNAGRSQMAAALFNELADPSKALPIFGPFPTLGRMARTTAKATAARVEKVSISLGRDELSWARDRAKRLGKTLSAVMAEALRKQKQIEARRDVLDWLSDGQPPLTRKELAAVEREWKG